MFQGHFPVSDCALDLSGILLLLWHTEQSRGPPLRAAAELACRRWRAWAFANPPSEPHGGSAMRKSCLCELGYLLPILHVARPANAEQVRSLAQAWGAVLRFPAGCSAPWRRSNRRLVPAGAGRPRPATPNADHRRSLGISGHFRAFPRVLPGPAGFGASLTHTPQATPVPGTAAPQPPRRRKPRTRSSRLARCTPG
jgi:hypothetical protein